MSRKSSYCFETMSTCEHDLVYYWSKICWGKVMKSLPGDENLYGQKQ